MAKANHWPDDLVERLAQRLWLDKCERLGPQNHEPTWEALESMGDLALKIKDDMRAFARTSLDFCFASTAVEITLPYRIGFVMGSLENDETMKAVYPNATKGLRRTALDILGSVTGRIPYSESVVPKGRRR